MALLDLFLAWASGTINAVIFLSVIAAVYYVSRRTWSALKELIVIRNVAAFASSNNHHINPKDRLLLFACTSDQIPEACLEEMYKFSKDMMESTVTLEQFRKIIYSYDRIFLFRDRINGTLCGLFLMGFTEEPSYAVIKLGLAFFKSHYRGSSLFYAVLLYYYLEQFIRHPTRPVYVIGKVFSYKSYLLGVRNFKSFLPRYDCPEIPSFEKSIMDEFGHSFETAGNSYDPNTCVIATEATKLKMNVAPINEDLLQNPHIKYFQELNPEWQKGHCLVTIAKIDWFSLLEILWNTLKRILPFAKRSKRTSKRSKGRHFLSETEFLLQQRLNMQGKESNKAAYYQFDGFNVLEVSEECEKNQTVVTKRRSNVSRTSSIDLGIDRIDEYSDIHFS